MASMMVYLIVGFSLGVVVLQLVSGFLQGRKRPMLPAPTGRYRSRVSLLDEEDARFFTFLAEAVRPALLVLARVPLSCVVEVKIIENTRTVGEAVPGAFLPFVLCEPVSLRPVAVVDLERSSLLLGNASQREPFLEAVLNDAGIPLIKVKSSSSYDVNEVRAAIRQAVWK